MEQTNFDGSKGFQTQADFIGQVGDRYEMSGPQEILVAGVCDLPPSLGLDWIAREELQAKVRTCLKQQPVTELVAAGGFGKSLLAAWMFEALRDEYDKRLWVNFRQPRWQQALSFDRFARGMLQEIERPMKDPRATPEDLLSELCLRLGDPNNHKAALVVLDNLESLRSTKDWPLFERFLQMWASRGQRSRVLATTRPAAVTNRTVTIGGLSETEGTAFLQQRVTGGDQFEELVRLTAGHPLLLKLAATWVGNTEDAAVDSQALAFFRQLFEQMPDLARSLSATDLEAAVALVFTKVFAALPPALQKGLQQVCVYRVPFNQEMAQAMVPELTAEDLQSLAKQALLVTEEEGFTLHPLIEDLVQRRISEDLVSQAHKQAIIHYQNYHQRWDGTIASCREFIEAFYHSCELGRYAAAIKIINLRYVSLYRAGYWGELLSLYQQLSQQWQVSRSKTQHYPLQVSLWSGLGELFLSVGSLEKSITAYERTKSIAELCEHTQGRIYALNGLGNVNRVLGNYERAADFHQQALSIRRNSASLSGLGLSYAAMKQYERAISFYQQVLVIEQNSRDRSTEAGTLCNMGHTYEALGKHHKALDFYHRSLKIHQQIGFRNHEANSLGGLGDVYLSLEQYERAVDFYQQSLTIRREIFNRSGEAYSLRRLGDAYYSLKRYDRARDFYQQSLVISQKLGNRSSEAHVYWWINICYQQCGRLRRATYYRHHAYRIWHDMQLPIIAAPLPAYWKNFYIRMEAEEDWAKTLLESERKMAWLFLPLWYLLFIFRKLISPFFALRKIFKTQKKPPNHTPQKS